MPASGLSAWSGKKCAGQRQDVLNPTPIMQAHAGTPASRNPWFQNPPHTSGTGGSLIRFQQNPGLPLLLGTLGAKPVSGLECLCNLPGTDGRHHDYSTGRKGEERERERGALRGCRKAEQELEEKERERERESERETVCVCVRERGSMSK